MFGYDFAYYSMFPHLRSDNCNYPKIPSSWITDGSFLFPDILRQNIFARVGTFSSVATPFCWLSRSCCRSKEILLLRSWSVSLIKYHILSIFALWMFIFRIICTWSNKIIILVYISCLIIRSYTCISIVGNTMTISCMKAVLKPMHIFS